MAVLEVPLLDILTKLLCQHRRVSSVESWHTKHPKQRGMEGGMMFAIVAHVVAHARDGLLNGDVVYSGVEVTEKVNIEEKIE